MTSTKQKRTSRISGGVPKRPTAAEPSLPYEEWLVEQLKDPVEAAAYVEAVIEEGNQAALMLALRQVCMAQGGVAGLARRAKVTREAAYRMLSPSGNPELRSLIAILDAAGLRLSVKPAPAKAGERTAGYRVSKQPVRRTRARSRRSAS